MARPTLNGPRLPLGNFSSRALSAVSCYSLQHSCHLPAPPPDLHSASAVVGKPDKQALRAESEDAASEGLCLWREE